jgi:hypothetical protein
MRSAYIGPLPAMCGHRIDDVLRHVRTLDVAVIPDQLRRRLACAQAVDRARLGRVGRDEARAPAPI